DATVTGVQTCALPISGVHPGSDVRVAGGQRRAHRPAHAGAGDGGRRAPVKQGKRRREGEVHVALDDVPATGVGVTARIPGGRLELGDEQIPVAAAIDVVETVVRHARV